MKTATARYVKRSICPCGFSILRDEIPLGKTYTVYPETINRNFNLVCGGCRQWKPVAVIKVDDIDGSRWMPLEIFKLEYVQ